jgi:hypothetical protein
LHLFEDFSEAERGTIVMRSWPLVHVSRRYPDYAKRPHAVLYRESGPQVLGLGDSKEAVTLPDVDWGTL